ncbi:hypothetical protein Ahy_B10g104891 [Arachis hypogaea]|uniref:CCHC-type domain-containing protein n=1 Tax=Arachis hypogaea TaxID=3818 RepID=A0A444X6P2_ARAHY|nr:hypothetical protein Ahy_B10g104891 [Arachis hypogaea]
MELSAEVGNWFWASNFLQDDPPLASLPLHCASPGVHMDMDSEKSDEEYVADSNKNGSFEDDDEQKFVPENPIVTSFPVSSCTYCLCRCKYRVGEICSSSVYIRGSVQVNEQLQRRQIHEKLWLEWYGTCLRPNPAIHKKVTGRPVSTRFHNEIDEVERAEKRCGLCKQTGHTRKGCPNKPTEDT